MILSKESLMFQIAPLQESDLPRFTELWNQGYAVLTSKQRVMTVEKAHEGFTAALFTYVGIRNDAQELVGFLLLKEDNTTVWIMHMLVDQHWRGKGIGGKLVLEAKHRARMAGKKVAAEVLWVNRAAKSFYTSRPKPHAEACGWRPIRCLLE